MQMGLDTNYLKLLMAVIFTIALVGNQITLGRRKKQHVDPTKI
jgi:putative ABC transport system permease protein